MKLKIKISEEKIKTIEEYLENLSTNQQEIQYIKSLYFKKEYETIINIFIEWTINALKEIYKEQ